jgi:hypothetical protein
MDTVEACFAFKVSLELLPGLWAVTEREEKSNVNLRESVAT